MRVQLAQQVQELVGTSELVITLADGIWPANAFERVVNAPVGLLLDFFNHGHGACVHRLGRAKLSCQLQALLAHQICVEMRLARGRQVQRRRIRLSDRGPVDGQVIPDDLRVARPRILGALGLNESMSGAMVAA